jgi:hypothetical protein
VELSQLVVTPSRVTRKAWVMVPMDGVESLAVHRLGSR